MCIFLSLLAKCKPSVLCYCLVSVHLTLCKWSHMDTMKDIFSWVENLSPGPHYLGPWFLCPWMKDLSFPWSASPARSYRGSWAFTMATFNRECRAYVASLREHSKPERTGTKRPSLLFGITTHVWGLQNSYCNLESRRSRRLLKPWTVFSVCWLYSFYEGCQPSLGSPHLSFH